MNNPEVYSKELLQINGLKSLITQIDISYDLQHIVFADKNELQVWNLITKQLIFSYIVNQSRITSLDWNNYLLVGTNTGKIYKFLNDLVDESFNHGQNQIKKLLGYEEFILSIGKDSEQVFLRNQNKVVRQIKHPAEVFDFDVGENLITTCGDGKIRIYDMDQLIVLQTINLWCHSINFWRNSIVAGEGFDSIKFIDKQTKQIYKKLIQQNVGHPTILDNLIIHDQIFCDLIHIRQLSNFKKLKQVLGTCYKAKNQLLALGGIKCIRVLSNS
ncbi:hypothetical protein pb186bvf_014576 [Paramecium bursaria]